MTFGKYKGQDIVDLPTSYLIWIEENVESLTKEQRDDLNFEIGRRESDRPGQGRLVRWRDDPR